MYPFKKLQISFTSIFFSASWKVLCSRLRNCTRWRDTAEATKLQRTYKGVKVVTYVRGAIWLHAVTCSISSRKTDDRILDELWRLCADVYMDWVQQEISLHSSLRSDTSCYLNFGISRTCERVLWSSLKLCCVLAITFFFRYNLIFNETIVSRVYETQPNKLT